MGSEERLKEYFQSTGIQVEASFVSVASHRVEPQGAAMSHEPVYEVLVDEVLLDTGIRQYTGDIPALRSYCFADTLPQLRQVVSGTLVTLHAQLSARYDVYRRLQAEQQILDVLSFYEEEGLDLPVIRKLPSQDETAKTFWVAVKVPRQGPHIIVAKSCPCLYGTGTRRNLGSD